mmetsp:Transcript_44290/g.106700  ORF Transcript_44290/g.106700 Transcript_44290/m.106700 type:complete len:486 (-) Transcript_44290:465-1922(-)
MFGHPRRLLWTLTLLASSTSPTSLLIKLQPSGLLASAFTITSTSATIRSKTGITQRQATSYSTSRRTLNMAKSSDDAQKKINNIVVVGGGIQGTSVAYQLAQAADAGDNDTKITILEAKAVASAASGKGGGFMARSWGDGSPTQSLHELAFDMYEELAAELQCESYRKLPVLSVSPGGGGKSFQSKDPLVPNWLDGNVARISPMGYGDDTAQITPKEFVEQMLQHAPDIQVVLGKCTGVETLEEEEGDEQITGVKYRNGDDDEEKTLPADVVVVSAGPWSCQAEDWFPNAGLKLPMEGIKSTSIVWNKPDDRDVDATALFCGENSNFGTHLEVYPRPDGSIYICGIGGSDYISTAQLKDGAFLEDCEANPTRVKAAQASFRDMAPQYKEENGGSLEKSQACMRPCPPDAMPYMGPVPGYSGAYLNAGHNCWGIAWAPACGKAMAELIWEGSSSSVNLKPFDPARFTPKVAQRGRKRRGTNVGEQW